MGVGVDGSSSGSSLSAESKVALAVSGPYLPQAMLVSIATVLHFLPQVPEPVLCWSGLAVATTEPSGQARPSGPVSPRGPPRGLGVRAPPGQ